MNFCLINGKKHKIKNKQYGLKTPLTFIGSATAGKSMGILYSFVQTCRALKVDPQKYLEDIFRRLPGHPHKNLNELLPDQWKKNHSCK